MASKAMGIGAEAVVNWFTNNADHEAPFFSVWSGRNILFSNISTDFEKAVELINDNIEAAAQNGYDDLMTIKLNCLPQRGQEGSIKSPRYINDKTPVYASFQFRPTGVHPNNFVVPYPRENSNVESAILQKLNGIEERLNSIENDEDLSEDEANKNEKISIAGIANNLLSSPEMQQVIIGFIGNIAQKMFPQKTQQNFAINGIPNIDEMNDEEKINKVIESINILQRVRPQIIEDLINLAEISQTDPNKANWILSMLPK
jgi:hypothetical protein